MTRQEAENINLAECTDAEFEEWLKVWRPIFEQEWKEFNLFKNLNKKYGE
jgi:hypothetical protein